MNKQIVAIAIALLGLSLCEAKPTEQRVKVSLYYESLCPGCHAFILNQLSPTFQKLGSGAIDLELVPFGNAHVDHYDPNKEPVFKCQHGEAECYGNLAQTCVLHYQQDISASFNYVLCMESQQKWYDTHKTAPECAKKQNIDWSKIDACIKGGEGEKLMVANWKKTANLKPAHRYVPWITINDEHTEAIQNGAMANLEQYLCQHYLQQRCAN